MYIGYSDSPSYSWRGSTCRCSIRYYPMPAGGICRREQLLGPDRLETVRLAHSR